MSARKLKTESREVLLQLRSAYGRDRIYPVCKTSQDLTALTGRKTLLESDLAVIQRLGFDIRWLPATVELCEK